MEFLIASPLSQSGSSKRTCFTFKGDPSGTLSVLSSIEESCRSFADPQGLFGQNLTVESKFAVCTSIKKFLNARILVYLTFFRLQVAVLKQ